jgi:tetratricopeptide (TPR) repeat protein
MSTRHKVSALVLSLGLFLVLAAPLRAQTGGMEGVVKDIEGNLLAGVTIEIIRTDISGKYEVKTNDKGYYIYMGLPAGGATYNVRVVRDGQQLYQLTNIRVSTGDIRKVDIDLQKEQQMQRQQLTEEQKRQIQEQQMAVQDFESMKQNYELGMALLREPSGDLLCSARCPQEGPDAGTCLSDCQAQASGGQLEQMAYAAASAALERASELDPTQVAVWANLGRAYGLSGQDEKGIEAYKKAIELSPEEAGLYNNLGQLYVKLTRMDEAQQAFTKAAELNPEQAGAFFYNLGVTFYNAGNVAAAIEPFRKATEIDPDRADAFYLLGVCLYGQAEFKQEGDQWITVLKPGTRESFERYLEIAPNGKFAEMAKDNLQAIEATAPTSVNVKNN